jgi:VIT1/CCC1 family predicted Fe2+/Mn2+ transporter
MERAEVYDILRLHGIHHRDADWAVNKLTEHQNAHKWARFMLLIQLRLPEPTESVRRMVVSAVAVAGAWFVGGLVPVVPFLFAATGEGEVGVTVALAVSTVVTMVLLAGAGYMRTWIAVQERKLAYWGAAQAVGVAVLAAVVGFGVVCLPDFVIASRV